jgi:hypothetical protein
MLWHACERNSKAKQLATSFFKARGLITGGGDSGTKMVTGIENSGTSGIYKKI